MRKGLEILGARDFRCYSSCTLSLPYLFEIKYSLHIKHKADLQNKALQLRKTPTPWTRGQWPMNTRAGHIIGSIDTDLMINENESIIRQPRYLEVRVSSPPSQIMSCTPGADRSHAVSNSSSGTTASSGSSSAFSPIVNLIFDSGSDCGSSTTCRRDALYKMC